MRKRHAFSSFSWTVGIALLLLGLGDLARVQDALAAQGGSSAPRATFAAVPSGTHLLIRLDEELNSGKNKVNKTFGARTLEPLESSDGSILPAGAKIRGHVSRVEPGGITGRASLWLTFDDIESKRGRLPLIAEVSSVPGDFGVRPGESKEGEIEARTSKGAQDFEAAAAGAAIGAAAGAAAHGGAKGAAIGAATGGVAGFVVSSGIGQELDLPKGTKIELVLDRPLYMPQ
ncbi:MAG: hypothetical protein ACRD4Y_03685 [Candidatus Acidiferrales bacterium]